jgi:putative inorganic carbon (HCO3(-)) transporter
MQSSTITWGSVPEDNRLVVAFALLGAILAASALYTPLPLVLLIGIPASLYFISRPYELLLAMVFLIPFNFVFRIGPIPVAVELLKVFAWIPLLVHLRARKQPFKTSRYNWCFAVLAALLFLSIFRSHDLPFTLKESIRLGSNIGLCYLALNLVDSREKVFQIFRVLAFSTFLVACYGFYQFAIKDFGGLFWIVNPRIDTALAHGRDTFWEWRDRITSVFRSEMELADYFNLCLPVGVVLWLTEGRKRIGSRWLLMTVAILAGLLFTFTFGAWLSLVATTGLFAILVDTKRWWKMVLAGALALALFAIVFTVGPFRPLIEDRVGQMAFDAATRLDGWGLAWSAFRSHPMLGIGYGNFPSLTLGSLEWITQEWVPSGSSPHNFYFYLLSELGLVGLVSIVFIFISTVRANIQLRSTHALGYIGLALSFALTTALIDGFSDDSALYGPHAGYLLWLFIGMSEAVRNLSEPMFGIRRLGATQ